MVGRRAALAVLAVLAVVWSATQSQALAAQPVELAAPYEYLGWGDPQPPAEAMAVSGLHDVTLAFILAARHGCTPAWDGKRPLLGGIDQAAIESVRAAGGDVDVSFG